MSEWKRFFPRNMATWPESDGEYMVAAATRQGFGPNMLAKAYWRKREWLIDRENRHLGFYPHTITHFSSLPDLPAGPILESVTVVEDNYWAIWGPEVDGFPESSIIQDPGGESDE